MKEQYEQRGNRAQTIERRYRADRAAFGPEAPSERCDPADLDIPRR
jgi:hypothetical protein